MDTGKEGELDAWAAITLKVFQAEHAWVSFVRPPPSHPTLTPYPHNPPSHPTLTPHPHSLPSHPTLTPHPHSPPSLPTLIRGHV